MGRVKNAIASDALLVRLPAEEAAMLRLHLHSELEGRIPRGAFRDFFAARIREYFKAETLDLSPYLGLPPCSALVRCAPETAELIRMKMEKR